MSTIQYGWHRSQFVTPKPNEIVWVVDDEKEVRLAVYESMCKDGTPWRVFGETTRLYGFRWWQRCADNMRPPPEPPKEEAPAAPQEGVYGPGDPPDMAPSLLPQNPDRVNAPEPLGEPANIRTELAGLQSDLVTILCLVEKLKTAVQLQNFVLSQISNHVFALDSHQKQVDARLDEIEKHTDFSHNSK